MKPSVAPPVSVRYSSLGRRSRAPTIARLMTMALENPSLLSLAAGFTASRSLPAAAVAAAVGDLTATPGDPEYLQYGANRGRPRLRRLLAERLVAQEPGLDPAALEQGMMVTNGSQQALYLAMQVLADPGDVVLVDRPSYFVFLELLAGMGVEARSIPVGPDHRVDAEALAELLRGMRATGTIERLKGVYFVSYYSNPSGRTLTAEDKQVVAEVLAREDVILPVLEDAAYRELFYHQPPAAPSVLSLPAWQRFPRLYLSTLTKPFASGLKVGYAVCSDRDWLDRMLHVKGHQDFGTANFNQAVLEHALERGGYAEQLQQIRPLYAGKMRALHEALEAEGLRDLGWQWERPEGGLYLWLSAPRGLETGLESAFCRACIAEGVIYVPGDLCYGDDPPRNRVRLSFGVLEAPQLREAARRFGAVARRFAMS